jgi:PRC-barrel domain protein
MAINRDREVVPLGELTDFRVAPGYPDARGYAVVSSEGRVVGKVRELLVDPQALRTRFLEIEETSIREGGAGNCVLLSVSDVRISGREHIVHAEGLTAADFANLPSYADSTSRAGDRARRSSHEAPKCPDG